MTFNLSKKIVDVLQMYRHKDIAEFIRLLKEDIDNINNDTVLTTKGIKKFLNLSIKHFAGEKFQ